MLMIRSDIRESIKKKWWQRGKLDEFRRRELEKMITDYITESQEKLAKALLIQIRDFNSIKNISSEEKLKRLNELEDVLWNNLENRDLSESQHDFLSKVMQIQKESIVS